MDIHRASFTGADRDVSAHHTPLEDWESWME